MTWYFDSHIHLSDPQYNPDMDFILQEMDALKIKACCVSMDVQNSLETLELAKKSNLVLPFIGIHPECASDELEKVVLEQCGQRWYNLFKRDPSIHGEPYVVGMSRIYLKINLENTSSGEKKEKTISFEIPMGC